MSEEGDIAWLYQRAPGVSVARSYAHYLVIRVNRSSHMHASGMSQLLRMLHAFGVHAYLPSDGGRSIDRVLR